jgi:hypothetical protein
MLFLILVFTYVSIGSSTISKSLASGSFDDQTYGKDGVVLLWGDERVDTYDSWVEAINETTTTGNINFWDLSCSIAPEFCELNARGMKPPFVLYSFRNEPWQRLSVRKYDKHAFTTFFNTHVNANCYLNRSICTYDMNVTLEKYKNKEFGEIREAYIDAQQRATQVEFDWGGVSASLQKDFITQRKKVQDEINVLDERMKALGQMLESMHHDNYRNREGPIKLEL